MGMVVRTNTMSTNAYRQLGMNNTALSKSLEKLSSGFRINRAGDDSSGLAISEKMKAQIKGLEQASANSQDGISLVQTAEGALTEVHSMLNRMVTLATKSANGTIQNDVDREAIQTEVDALNTEISRIAKSTNFNGINLLDGSLSSGVNVTKATVAGAAGTVSAITASASEYEIQITTKATLDEVNTATISYVDASGNNQTTTVDFTDGTDPTTVSTTADVLNTALAANTALKDLFDFSAATDTITATSKATGSTAPKITNITFNSGSEVVVDKAATAAADAGSSIAAANTLAAGDSITVNGKTFAFVANGDDASAAPEGTIGVELGADLTGTAANLQAAMTAEGMTNIKAAASGTALNITAAGNGSALELQVGTTNDTFNKVTVSIDNLTAEGLGTNGLKVSSQTDAGASLETIKTAINTVSTNRGNLGALQNRLEYAINNLDTTAENMDAANSRIRDTDMAKEMMAYTKMNILSQAAQAMLAQANQNPQSILQLLQ